MTSATWFTGPHPISPGTTPRPPSHVYRRFRFERYPHPGGPTEGVSHHFRYPNQPSPNMSDKALHQRVRPPSELARS